MTLNKVQEDFRGEFWSVTGFKDFPEAKIIKTNQGCARGGCVHGQDEQLLVLEGNIDLFCGDIKQVLKKGDKVTIFAGCPHFIFSTTSSTIMEWGARENGTTKDKNVVKIVDDINSSRDVRLNDSFFPIGDLSIPAWTWGERKSLKSGKMNKCTMYKNMLDFKESCDKYNLDFAIIFGSLLGLIRGGDLIDNDSDIDVACFTDAKDWKDYYKFGYVVEDMRRKGFYVADRNFCPWHDINFVRGGEKIEMWLFQKIDNEFIYDNVVRYPAHYFEPLASIEFLGTKFKVPNNAASFLEYTYGGDWRIPNPNGSYILASRRKK